MKDLPIYEQNSGEKDNSGEISRDTIIQLKNNDLKAFNKIFIRYSGQIFRFAYSYLKNTEDAQELVQDVFLKVWENRFFLNEDLSFNAYLYTIARNTIFNYFKKREYDRVLINTLRDQTPTVIYQDHYQDTSKLEEKTQKAIEKLPPRRRETFLLSRIAGLTYNEIAERLQISSKTVENQISKALKSIREELNYAEDVAV